MRGVVRALAISTLVVVWYTVAVVLLWILFKGLFGDNGLNLVRPLSMPLELPWSIYRTILPIGAPHAGRPPIAYVFPLVGTLGANIFLYYIPIRLLLQWREQNTKLP